MKQYIRTVEKGQRTAWGALRFCSTTSKKVTTSPATDPSSMRALLPRIRHGTCNMPVLRSSCSFAITPRKLGMIRSSRLSLKTTHNSPVCLSFWMPTTVRSHKIVRPPALQTLFSVLNWSNVYSRAVFAYKAIDITRKGPVWGAANCYCTFPSSVVVSVAGPVPGNQIEICYCLLCDLLSSCCLLRLSRSMLFKSFFNLRVFIKE